MRGRYYGRMEISWDDLSCYRFTVIATREDIPRTCAICGRHRGEHILTGYRLMTEREARAERADAGGKDPIAAGDRPAENAMAPDRAPSVRPPDR